MPATENVPEGANLRTTDTTYSADYWDTLDGGLGYQDSTMWEDIAHTLKEVFCIGPEGDRSGTVHTIDVGCAMGYLVKHLRRRGVDCWGLDFSHYALGNADLDTLPFLRWFDLTAPNDSHFGQASFDLVVCFETLEHLPAEHATRAVEHLWNLLQPGGLAVLTICVAGREGAESDPTHVNVVERAFWQDLFDKMGWRTEKDLLRQLQGYWLFREHHGVFVLRRPGNIGS